MLLYPVNVRWNVVHDKVEMSLVTLISLSQLGKTFLLLRWCINKVGVAQSDDVLVVHVTMDLQLSALILFVLLDFLNRDVFTGALESAHPHGCESANSALDFFRELVSLLLHSEEKESACDLRRGLSHR